VSSLLFFKLSIKRNAADDDLAKTYLCTNNHHKLISAYSLPNSEQKDKRVLFEKLRISLQQKLNQGTLPTGRQAEAG
jgi:hypothetical protein